MCSCRDGVTHPTVLVRGLGGRPPPSRTVERHISRRVHTPRAVISSTVLSCCVLPFSGRATRFRVHRNRVLCTSYTQRRSWVALRVGQPDWCPSCSVLTVSSPARRSVLSPWGCAPCLRLVKMSHCVRVTGRPAKYIRRLCGVYVIGSAGFVALSHRPPR